MGDDERRRGARPIKAGEPDWGSFGGYAAPRFTQIPHELLDRHLAFLTGNEVKVLLYIARKTYGWKKHGDQISLKQMLKGQTRKDGTRLDFGVGMSRAGLVAALDALEIRNLIRRQRRDSVKWGHEPTVYSLHRAFDPDFDPCLLNEQGSTGEEGDPCLPSEQGLVYSTDKASPLSGQQPDKPRQEKYLPEVGTTPLPPGQGDLPVQDLDQTEHRIFDAWQGATGHPRADLSPKRLKLIRDRLRDKFTEAELIIVVADAWRLDPWRERAKHNWIEQLLRTKEGVQKWLDLHDRAERGESTVTVIEGGGDSDRNYRPSKGQALSARYLGEAAAEEARYDHR